MDGGRTRKANAAQTPSPVMLRRRLSAPEIVMRKHMLAQQQSDSQESDVKSCQFRNEFSVGSDSSLNRKRDSGFMRRSTLLRRLWSNSSASRMSSHQSSPAKTTSKTTTETDFEPYTTTTTASLDNSDSAFSNSRSVFSTGSSEIQKVVVGSSEVTNDDVNKALDANANRTEDSETQTLKTTNVNVISNVQLSKTTLDIIYSQVIKDVQSADPEPRLVTVQQIPSFYLKTSEMPSNPKHDQMKKYMIGNVGTGSPYSKPAEIPQVVVPRFSAYPRTTSMEVNTSSADSTDRESDSVSLVDSLEDPSSPHTDFSACKHDEKPVRGSISSLLPDNSDNKRVKNSNKAFFIPIETDAKLSTKAVADHLPEKVRERLSRRQLELKNKVHSPRSDSNYVSSSENSHHLHIRADESSGNDGGNTKHRRRSKPLLPSIQTTRKIKIDSKNESRSQRSRRKSLSTDSSKSKHSVKQKLSPLYTTKNEYRYDTLPGKIYHKTELNNVNKRIEILEIMECIDVTPEKYTHLQKGRSRIPVFVHPKLPKINQEKPTFLEFQEVRMEDPKIDQLIANILIDTLNKVEEQEEQKKESVKVEDERKPSKNCSGNKYQQKFEVIPEEFLQTSSEGNNNGSADKEEEKSTDNNNVKGETYKGKAALALVKDENLSTIPQGWITFYMLQKSQGSPDSTSDEGQTGIETETKQEAQQPSEGKQDTETASKENSDSFEKSSCTDVDINDNLSKALPQLQTKHKRRMRIRKTTNPQPRGWSVTVSGTNTCGEFAPNLEMRLKFPQSNQQNVVTSDSGLGDEQSHKRKSDLSRASENICDLSSNENDKSIIDSHRCKLPSINKERPTRNGRESVLTARNEPRQTKTSSTRMSLNRPKQLPLLSPNIDFNSEERQLEEFLRRFPHFLSVTGNAICQERRPRIYAITERDILRYTNQR